MPELALIEKTELQQIVHAAMQPLHQEIKELRLIIETDGKPLTPRQFATRSGYSYSKVMQMIKDNLISHNQTCRGGKITIPATELAKVKQFQS